jgi:hypothetical protein
MSNFQRLAELLLAGCFALSDANRFAVQDVYRWQ